MFLSGNPSSLTLFSFASVAIFLAILELIVYQQFLRLAHLDIIKRRFPKIIDTQVLVLSAFLILTLPTGYYNKAFLLAHDHDHEDTHFDHLDLVHQIQFHVDVILRYALNPSIIIFLSHLEAMRQWLIFYRLKTMESTLCIDWGDMISSSWSDHWRHKFFQKHRGSLGTYDWLKKRVFVYWLAVSSLTSSLSYYVGKNIVTVSKPMVLGTRLLQALVTLSPLVSTSILWCRLPKLQGDQMLIEAEFKMSTYVVLVTTLNFLASLVTQSVDNEVLGYLTAPIERVGQRAGRGTGREEICTSGIPKTKSREWTTTSPSAARRQNFQSVASEHAEAVKSGQAKQISLAETK